MAAVSRHRIREAAASNHGISIGAFTYHSYSWISILINVPATIFATGFYELLMRGEKIRAQKPMRPCADLLSTDSLQKIGKGHAVYEDSDDALARHLTKTGIPTSHEANGNVKIERGFAVSKSIEKAMMMSETLC